MRTREIRRHVNALRKAGLAVFCVDESMVRMGAPALMVKEHGAKSILEDERVNIEDRMMDAAVTWLERL